MRLNISFSFKQYQAMHLFLFTTLIGFSQASLANESRFDSKLKPIQHQGQTVIKKTVGADKPQQFRLQNNRWVPAVGNQFGIKQTGNAAVCGASSSISAALDMCNDKFLFASCTKSSGTWTCKGTVPKPD